MFRYFPTNYVWNLSVDLAIEMGARIGEIEAMCAPLQEAAKQPDAAGTRAFRETWSRMADQLCELAREDESRGRLLSAGEKLNRAVRLRLSAYGLKAMEHAGGLDAWLLKTDNDSLSPTALRLKRDLKKKLATSEAQASA